MSAITSQADLAPQPASQTPRPPLGPANAPRPLRNKAAPPPRRPPLLHIQAGVTTASPYKQPAAARLAGACKENVALPPALQAGNVPALSFALPQDLLVKTAPKGPKTRASWLQTWLPKSLYTQPTRALVAELTHAVRTHHQHTKTPAQAEHWLAAQALPKPTRSSAMHAHNALMQLLRKDAQQLAQEGPLPGRAGAPARPHYKTLDTFAAHKLPYRAKVGTALGFGARERVREVLSPYGYFFVTQSLTQGGFGKFRLLSDLQGTVYGVKEFRLQAKHGAAAPKHTKSATGVTQANTLEHEIAAIQRYGQGIQLFGSFTWKENFYLLMTPAKGDFLDLFWSAPAQLQPALACAATLQMADALDFLHRRHGVLHRDFKFSNVLVTYDQGLVLWDFGMAKAYNTGRRLFDDFLCGTNIAPELVLSEMALPRPVGLSARFCFAYSAAFDAWSLGVAAIGLFALHGDIDQALGTKWYPHNRPGLDFSVNGYVEFANWYAELQDADGFISLHTLGKSRAHRKLDVFFRKVLGVWPEPVLELLNHLLVPDEGSRTSLTHFSKLFGARLAGPVALGNKAIGVMPEMRPQKRARQTLRAYTERHIMQQEAADLTRALVA